MAEPSSSAVGAVHDSVTCAFPGKADRPEGVPGIDADIDMTVMRTTSQSVFVPSDAVKLTWWTVPASESCGVQMNRPLAGSIEPEVWLCPKIILLAGTSASAAVSWTERSVPAVTSWDPMVWRTGAEFTSVTVIVMCCVELFPEPSVALTVMM